MTKPRKHLIIPDCQVRPGVRTDHLSWIANYIDDKRPDVIVCLGDFADMNSLNHYDSAKDKEGKRYRNDVDAAWSALNQLNSHAKYKCRKVMTLGNHENRINRMVDEHPNLAGTMSVDDLGYRTRGWEVHPFLKVVSIDGVQYSHYFVSGVMGRPVSSAAALLRERQRSAVQGHVQKFDVAVHPKTQQTAIMAGICYLHDEPYLGPQGNSTKRQILMLHEVHQGRFDLMAVSLDFLKREYS